VSKALKSGRIRRGILIAGASCAALAAGTWIAIHEIPGFGPALADGVRSVVGPGPVAWAEDVVYGAADLVNTTTRANEAPKTFWEVPAAQASELPKPDASTKLAVETAGPSAFVPPFPAVASPADGAWIPVEVPGTPGPTLLWKSLVHPDAKRPFAAVAVVAIDLSGVELHLVAGTDEPKSPRFPYAERTGLVATEHHDDVLAVFNGGFKAMHGNYGVRIGATQFLPPRDIACTIGHAADGSLTIGTFSAISSLEPGFTWYRQTPPCLLEKGTQNPGLLHEFNKNWGATVGGDTIIRRSAFGLSKDARWGFYALGDAVTAQSIGRAMEAVGCDSAAQLDVNHSYPRFLLLERGAAGLTATQPIIPDIKYSPADYVTAPSQRDFFYLTRKKRKAT
jgi:hypothetical protein